MFQSLRKQTQVDLKIFQKKVNEEIDKSIAIVEELEAGGIERQKNAI